MLLIDLVVRRSRLIISVRRRFLLMRGVGVARPILLILMLVLIVRLLVPGGRVVVRICLLVLLLLAVESRLHVQVGWDERRLNDGSLIASGRSGTNLTFKFECQTHGLWYMNVVTVSKR